MTFTNTDCVGQDWYLWRKVAGQVTKRARKQVTGHATGQVCEEINPIKYKITQEIFK